MNCLEAQEPEKAPKTELCVQWWVSGPESRNGEMDMELEGEWWDSNGLCKKRFFISQYRN